MLLQGDVYKRQARMYLLKEDWTNAAKYAKEARASYGAPADKAELIDEGLSLIHI